MKKSNIDEKRIIELYQKTEKTSRQLARDFYCGKTTILRILRRNNIERDRPIWNKGKTKETDKRLLAHSKRLIGKIPWNKGIGLKHSCKGCNKQISYWKKYCTHNCYFKNLSAWNKGRKMPEISGPNHYLWKGNPGKFRKRIRSLVEYIKWRKTVFARDNYTCQVCGGRGGYLQADHIKQFAIIMLENNIKTKEQAQKCSLLWNTKNGRTLCLKCHRKTDTFSRHI